MRSKEISIYTFGELNTEAQFIAIESFRGINIDDGWLDGVFEDFIQICHFIETETGIKDNAYKKSDNGNIEDYLRESSELTRILREEKQQRSYRKKADIRWRKIYWYRLENSIEEAKERAQEDLRKAKDLIDNGIKRLTDWLHKRLEEEYARLTSDGSIVEYIKKNNCEFTEDGIPWVNE